MQCGTSPFGCPDTRYDVPQVNTAGHLQPIIPLQFSTIVLACNSNLQNAETKQTLFQKIIHLKTILNSLTSVEPNYDQKHYEVSHLAVGDWGESAHVRTCVSCYVTSFVFSITFIWMWYLFDFARKKYLSNELYRPAEMFSPH